MEFKPHNYQDHSIQHIIDNVAAGLFLDMGLGKTVISLSALDILMYQNFEIEKVLIIAPMRVAEDTWSSEASKWAHLNHFKISIALGTERERIEALRKKADIYVINRENVEWLVSFYGGAWPFDTTVIDELSSFKSAKSRRFKALRTVRPKMRRVVGLTGTPAPNGLLDLWSQIYLLDQGERLGKTLTAYRDRYFEHSNYGGFSKYKLKPGADKLIYEKISDICISMKARDYLDLPERIDTVKMVHLPEKIMKQYYEFEKNLILSLDDVDQISAANAAVLTNKLLQFSNGAIYDAERKVHLIHDVKLDALEEDIEAANGKPVLVTYGYRHDIDRIMHRFRKLKPVLLQSANDVKKWNNKEIQLLVGHPKSMGHGLNMQDGGNLISHFSLQWGSELYNQVIKRLDRQGQTQIVTNNRILCAGTMDEDVLLSLSDKIETEDALMNAIKARIKKYKR